MAKEKIESAKKVFEVSKDVKQNGYNLHNINIPKGSESIDLSNESDETILSLIKANAILKINKK